MNNNVVINQCDLCTDRHCNGCKDGSNFKFDCGIKFNVEPMERREFYTALRTFNRSELYMRYIDPTERITLPDNYTIWGQRILQNGSIKIRSFSL